ncbi:AAA family ATPase [Rhodopseudomonas palustris]|uniref:Orc1-like AAA ATPase domain-containing protein n=1 Tax=Rhodopseudomonas palustris (strain BisB18) TaxID=316056 RepID=Q217T8_RHOPB
MTTLGMAIYDPRRLDDETFLAGFVARGDFVAFLLDKLRDMPELAEHHIIVGPRGMGKTSLLRRLAIGISSEPALRQRFIPLTFREEQYNVRSLDAFWRNCAESLAEWCESEAKADVAAEIDRSLLTPQWRDSNSAMEAFLALSKRLGGRPVLFVDNLDLILDALSAEQNWELRRILQAPGGPVLFGAATQLLRQSGERDAAFYEFFHPHMLDPLSEAELLQCMNRLAQARGEAGKAVSEILAREPERIRTLHTLTGGNPRVLTLVYQLLERSESDTVFSDLEVLLDQLTPFYKARVEEYQTDLQRAVIDAIALHWHPITSHDLSLATAVDVTTISPQLNRLKRDGLVEEVETSGARAGYQLVERFFNIWYLMRHGTRRTRQKIYWLTAFLSSFCAAAELAKMKSQAMSEGRANWHPLYLEALEAVGEGRMAELAPLRAALGELPPVGRELLDAAVEISSDNFGAAMLHLQEALAGDQDQLRSTFFEDLLRLLRIAEARGYGEKLIGWFVESGQAERQAPLYAAFVGYVRGQQFLLDFSPEIRKPAEPILRWLSSRRNSQPVQNPPKPKRRRGRPPRKHSTA